MRTAEKSINLKNILIFYHAHLLLCELQHNQSDNEIEQLSSISKVVGFMGPLPVGCKRIIEGQYQGLRTKEFRVLFWFGLRIITLLGNESHNANSSAYREAFGCM